MNFSVYIKYSYFISYCHFSVPFVIKKNISVFSKKGTINKSTLGGVIGDAKYVYIFKANPTILYKINVLIKNFKKYIIFVKKSIMATREKEEFSITEAKRYYANAKETIKNAKKADEFYNDSKYVKGAGSYLWLSVLIALDTVYNVKYSKGKSRVTFLDYKNALAEDKNKNKSLDKNIVKVFENAYAIIHLSMSYDGISVVSACNLGFDYAKQIIDFCEKQNNKRVKTTV